MSVNYDTLRRAQEAIDYIIACGEEGGTFLDMTRDQFAKELGWVDSRGNPQRKLVEDAFTCTRTQHLYPEAQGLLGGYTISYAPNRGGIALFDPDGKRSTRRLVNAVKGDIQMQQKIKTTNARRIPTWNVLGTQAANEGDMDFGRICWQIEHEIKTTGFVSDTLISEFFQALRVGGWFDDESDA